MRIKDLLSLKFICISFWLSLPIIAVSTHSAAGEEGFNHSTSLLVYEGAQEVEFSSSQCGTEQVVYKLQIPYPAEDLLAFLNNELESTGWSKIDEDFLNPGIKSSHTKGWRKYEVKRDGIYLEGYDWIAQWQNNIGDVVNYSLKYEYPRNEPQDLMSLKVFGSYSPEDIVKMLMRDIVNPKISNPPFNSDVK